MKRIIFCLLLLMSLSPAFAQGSKVGQTGIKLATQSDIALKVGQQFGKRVLARATDVPTVTALARISNLPGSPLVQIQLPQTAQSAIGEKILSVHTLEGQQLPDLVSKQDSQVYVHIPTRFNSGERALYRGLHLRNLDELKNILVNGLECNKTLCSQIFFTNRLYGSLGYASGLPYTDKERYLPRLVVLIQIFVNRPLVLSKFRRALYDEYVSKNLPADKLTDIMVFLEVNGQWNWYKVILQDGEIVFQQTPNAKVNVSDLFEFDIKADRIYWE